MSGIKLIDSGYRRPAPGETIELMGLPIEFSDLVPPGEAIVMDPNALIGRRLVLNRFDRCGYPVTLVKVPGYTRYTLGAREAARDRRRHA